MNNGRKFKLTDAEIDYLDGLFDAFDDLPDGAWQAACEDAVATCGRFKGRDPYDVWIQWVAVSSGRNP
jgi:hypothetical protein